MNFFKNNNLKDRLKSFKKEQMMEAVKKNKTSIILVSFILFVIASFAILIHGMGQQEESQEILFMEEKAQLMDMTSYLDEIGKVVSVNQERLAHSMLFQTDTEQTLQTYQEQLLLLESDLTQIDNILQNHTNTESIINSEMALSLTELSECHQEIKSQIASIHGGITEMLSVVRDESEEHFSTTFEKLTRLQKDLDKAQKDSKTYYDDLTDFLTLLNEGNEADFTITFEKLEQLQYDLEVTQEKDKNYYDNLTDFLALLKETTDNDTAITFEKLNLLKEELLKEQKIDKEHFNDFNDFLNLIKEENHNQKKELSDQLLLAQTAITELLEINFNSLQLKMQKDYLSLMLEMEDLHNQVENAHLSVTELLTFMEKADQNRQEEIGAAFASVNSSIDLIRTEYNSAHTNLGNLIQTVQESQIASYEETLSVLSEVETNLEKVSLENLEQLSNSLQVIEENFSSSLTAMQNGRL